jgi:hypothetical protein
VKDGMVKKPGEGFTANLAYDLLKIEMPTDPLGID